MTPAEKVDHRMEQLEAKLRVLVQNDWHGAEVLAWVRGARELLAEELATAAWAQESPPDLASGQMRPEVASDGQRAGLAENVAPGANAAAGRCECEECRYYRAQLEKPMDDSAT